MLLPCFWTAWNLPESIRLRFVWIRYLLLFQDISGLPMSRSCAPSIEVSMHAEQVCLWKVLLSSNAWWGGGKWGCIWRHWLLSSVKFRLEQMEEWQEKKYTCMCRGLGKKKCATLDRIWTLDIWLTILDNRDYNWATKANWSRTTTFLSS